MSLICTRMPSVCHSYLTRMYSYVIRVSLACTRMSSVCHSHVLVCHSYVLVCHPCATRMHLYVIRMPLVCTSMSSVCHSYVLACHPYVTRMWFYHEPCDYQFYLLIPPVRFLLFCTIIFRIRITIQILC